MRLDGLTSLTSIRLRGIGFLVGRDGHGRLNDPHEFYRVLGSEKTEVLRDRILTNKITPAAGLESYNAMLRQFEYIMHNMYAMYSTSVFFVTNYY